MEGQIAFQIVAVKEEREEAGNLFDVKITTIYIDKKNNRWMIKMKKLRLILFFILMLNGCGTIPIKNSKLLTVERPQNAKERYGEINITEVTENEKSYMEFEDDLIKSQFYFTNNSIGLILKNKTNYTIKINWDNAAFIDEFGMSKRVIHEGTNFLNRNLQQANSIIIKNGKISDSITPSDNIYFVEGRYGGWMHKSITTGTNVNVSLLLPIEIEGVVNDYIFNFNQEIIGETNAQAW